MLKVAHKFYAFVDNVTTPLAFDIGNKPHTTGIFIIFRVIETLSSGNGVNLAGIEGFIVHSFSPFSVLFYLLLSLTHPQIGCKNKLLFILLAKPYKP
jgi:hypothetical protein